jgi:hypothetical protein
MFDEKSAEKGRVGPDLRGLLDALDENSQTLLWHLWQNKHSRISELRRLMPAVSDYDVLYRLRDVINKKALELWHRPAVNFEESKSDPLTGEKVLFSWWLLDGAALESGGCKKDCVDIFEDKDIVTIVAQLPAREDAGDEKALQGSNNLDFKVLDVKYNNGVLQVSLGKERK